MQPENVQNVQNVLDVLDILDVLNVLNASAVTLWLEDSFYRLGYRGACYLLKYIAKLIYT